jgi:adenine-specific DNA-methyltransferase
MEKNIFEIAEEVLKTNSKYVSEDGKLLKTVVYSDIMTMDKELLSLLLSNERMKNRFWISPICLEHVVPKVSKIC